MRAQVTGSFAAYSRATGQDVTPRSRKARALLAYLISDAGKKVAKARLSTLLWGDRGDTQARSSLRQALVELRRALNSSHQVIFSDREHIWVSRNEVIEDPADGAGAREEAFEDLDDITPEFDEWLADERRRRSAVRIAQLKVRAEYLLASGRGADSSIVVDQIQLLDAQDEDALRLGMEAEFQRGRPAGIAKRFDTVAAVLKDELGVEPSSDNRQLRDRLLTQLVVVDRTSEAKFAALYEAAERKLEMGAWEYDLIRDRLFWTPGTFRLFGLPVDATLRRDEVLKQYEATSRARIEAARANAIGTGSEFNIEVDIVTPQGIRKRLRVHAFVERKDGIPLRIFGTKQLVGQLQGSEGVCE